MDKVEKSLSEIVNASRSCTDVVCSDQGEVVINHPDIKPDEHGVGHVSFSPDEARRLADSLNKQAGIAEREQRRKLEQARYAAAAKIPVDRSAITLTDGSPVAPDHTEIDPATGMQKGYVVLSEAERKKGFVRPVRDSYRHIWAPEPKHPLRDLTDEEKSRYGNEGYVKYEEYPEDQRNSSAIGRFWTQKQLNIAGKGCGQVTTMGRGLAETWARDVSFYSGTFCATCREHFPVYQFVWTGTEERVGS